MNRPARVLDPHSVPVLGTDSALPPVRADRLTPSGLREQFQQVRDWTPELSGDGQFLGDKSPAQAAVLMALVPRPDGLRVLLTRRTAHLRVHAGQISFPGGRVEAHDKDATATALREAEEEVGLRIGQVQVIGQLPPYATITNYSVTPVIGLVEPPVALHLDAFEVDEAFEVPLSFLMTPAHHCRHAFEFEGQRRQFLSMPWRGRGADNVEREYFIWGATAAMIRNLYGLLAR